MEIAPLGLIRLLRNVTNSEMTEFKLVLANEKCVSTVHVAVSRGPSHGREVLFFFLIYILNVLHINRANKLFWHFQVVFLSDNNVPFPQDN